MSYGMPKSYDAWRTAGPPETDHFQACPCSEDAPPICVCRCDEDHHDKHGVCRCEKKCLCEGWKHDEDPDCICDELGEGN